MNTTHTKELTELSEKPKAGQLLETISLRDYFAAKAMQALITNEVIHSVTMKEANKAGIPEEFAVAQMSFMVADAMMKARES